MLRTRQERRPQRTWVVVALVGVALLPTEALAGSGDEAVRRLVRQLGSDPFAEREAASKALMGLGERALPALRKATAEPELEMRLRAERLIRAIEVRRDNRRRWRVVPLLWRLGGHINAARHTEGQKGVSLGFSSKAVTDADLAVLRGWGAICELSVSNTAITDEGLQNLRELHNLRILTLCDTRITPEGLKQLRGLANLRLVIVFSNKDITAQRARLWEGALPNVEFVLIDPPSVPRGPRRTHRMREDP